MSGDVECAECGRTFDLSEDDEAEEWFFGHDCEERYGADWLTS